MSKSWISFYFGKSSGSKIELLLSQFSPRASTIGTECIRIHQEMETSNDEEYYSLQIGIINTGSSFVENL